MMSSTVNIAGRIVGEGHPVILSAEIGLNHNGDMELAKKMIQAAADCGCDAVKVQNYRTGDFVLNRHDMFDNGHGWVENKWAMCARHELDFSQLCELKKEADNCGVIFHSTPTNQTGVEHLVKMGIPIIKNGSDFLSDLCLLKCMVFHRRIIIQSTGSDSVMGVALDWEINNAYEILKNAYGLIFLHCVRKYPVPSGMALLERIPWLRKNYDCLAGYSDHTLGIDSAMRAVKDYGACWVEKHFTLDKTLPGPDHWFSADPVEMAALVKGVK